MGQNNKNNCPSNNCAEVLDLACAVYHFTKKDEPSRLIRLNFPNGTPANVIFEKIDTVLGSIPYEPLSKIDTNSVYIDLSGAGNHEISANVKTSSRTGNTLQINSDGLYVPQIPDLYKIKVNPTAIPYYLEDALIGGSDGIASLQFNASRGVLYGQPSGNTTSFVKAIVNDPSILFNLTGSIVNSLLSNSSFLNTLSDLEKTAILNDSNAINNLAIAMINNPDAMGNLCSALAGCASGATSCPDPYIVSSAVGVESTGGTVVLTINYVDSVPPPASGYTLSYRPKGSLAAYTIAGPFYASPIQLFGLPISDYEGLLQADCSGSTQSSGTTWVATLPCLQTISDGYILGSNCNGVPTVLYTSESFKIGITLYTDAGLTIPLTGQTSIVYAGYIYTVNPSTGIVVSQASPCSSPSTVNVSIKNYTGNGVAGADGSFSIVSDNFGGSVPSLVGGVVTTWGSISPVVAGTNRQGNYFSNSSSQLSIAFENDKGNQYYEIYAYLYVNNILVSTISKIGQSGILTFPTTLNLSDTSQQITIIVVS